MIERKNRTQQCENGLWHGRNKLIVEKKAATIPKGAVLVWKSGGNSIEIVWQRVKWVPMG